MKTTQIVQVFPANEVLRPDWRHCLESANYSVLPFDEDCLHQTVCILLFSPVRSLDLQWISPEFVWKNYFSLQFPEIKIVQVGYHRAPEATNYWHYGTPPAVVEECINKAVPAEQWKPLDTYGQDLGRIWAKFRDGHDQGGFMDWFNFASRRTTLSLEKIKHGISHTEVLDSLFNDPDTIESFDNTIIRWNRYYLYFIAAPCFKELMAIDQCIGRIAQYEQLKSSTNLRSNLTALANDFTKINDLLKNITPSFTYG